MKSRKKFNTEKEELYNSTLNFLSGGKAWIRIHCGSNTSVWIRDYRYSIQATRIRIRLRI
jgi:hypothetical protein